MLEAALVGRGNGEFIATTHCGGGGGGRADDMVKGCQREYYWSWLGEEARRVVWGGDRKVGKMTGQVRRFPPQLFHSHSALRLDSPFSPRPCLTRFFSSSHTRQLLVDLELCLVNDSLCLRFPRPGQSRGAVKTFALFSTSIPRSPPEPRSPKRPNTIDCRTD